MNTAKVLIVEDNEDMQQTMKEGLERDGYQVSIAGDGRQLMASLQDSTPDIILLDIGLPDTSGLSLMEKIRHYTNAPVIVVSGRNDSIDKIVGLEMGADDYIGKPFQMRELSARINAQLRRNMPERNQPPITDTKKAERLLFDDWIFDRPRLQVFSKSGVSAELTVKEFKLLEAFLNAPGRVLSREQLLDMSRNNDFNVTDRAIDTQIVRIRKKLHGENDYPIQAVRGAGYIFTAKVDIQR